MSRAKGLTLLLLLAFFNYLDRNLLYPVLPLLARELGISAERLGALATAFDVVYACSAPLLGVVSDRLSRKSLLLVSLVLWSVTTGLSGLATGFMSLLLFRAATGLSEGGYFPTALSVIGDLVPARRRTVAIALHSVCATLGGAAGYALGGVLGAHFGWRAPFLAALAPGLALAVVFWRDFREPERADAASEADRRSARRSGASARDYLRLVSAPPVLLTALAACLGSFAWNGVGVFLPVLLVEVRGVPVATAGALTGAFFTATIVGQLSGGTLSDRAAARVRGGRPLCVAVSYVAFAPALVAMGHVRSVAAILLCYGAGQVLRGVAEPSLFGTILDVTEPGERGSAQGFLLMLTFAGSSLAGWGVGAIIHAAGFVVALDVLAGAAALAGAFAGALVALQRAAAVAQAT